MYKKILLGIGLFFIGCGTGSKESVNKTTHYEYIPKEINKSIAIRFLNKATFGAKEEDVKYLQKKGVEKWLDEQLNMDYDDNIYLKKMILLAKQAEPQNYTYSLDEYLKDNDIVFNKKTASFQSSRYRITSWFDVALNSKKQLRYKTAYVLSQIIVESDFEPIFRRRAEALANYFDILAKNAFGSYQTLLEEISFSSGMALFLTYNGNKKVYLNDANVSVYPDENYAREIMQLFSIGLNELNIDGTAKTDKNGNLIPTYTQQDVNEIARVFTGWDLKRSWSGYWDNPRDIYGLIDSKSGDFTHNLEFSEKYHDFGAKKILGEKIPANLSGEEEIKQVISIIMKQPSVAPYISKNLIMRFTKSNPSPSYIKRVAEVFQNSNGDLKQVVKAIFLDPEFWDDLKQNRWEKFKEPLIAYTQFLRVFNAKPLELYYFCIETPNEDGSNCSKVKNSYLFNDTRKYLNQGPALAPTVFNFYDNSYIPNDTYFKKHNLVAPELQIQTDSMLINYSNHLEHEMFRKERNYILSQTFKLKDENKTYNNLYDFEKDSIKMDYRGKWVAYRWEDNFILDMNNEYEVVKNIVGSFEKIKDYREENESILDTKITSALIEHLNNKLLANLTKTQKEQLTKKIVENGIVSKYSKYSNKAQVYRNLIIPLVRYIITSSGYMTE